MKKTYGAETVININIGYIETVGIKNITTNDLD